MQHRTKKTATLALFILPIAVLLFVAVGASNTGAVPRISVPAVLNKLRHTTAITPAVYKQALGEYNASWSATGKLRGTRYRELAAVLANVENIAASNQLTASRVPALFLTLQRNREWWTTKPLLSRYQRVAFPGSYLVWEYYPGQGIEIQWLGTFGEIDGYYQDGNWHKSALRAALNEVIPLAARRAGGIAWEYLFQFDGGNPPWT